MAYTLSEHVSWGGSGGDDTGNPKFWKEDILYLIQEDTPDKIIERNIIFDKKELTGLMSADVKEGDRDRIVLLNCPPYIEPLVEITPD